MSAIGAQRERNRGELLLRSPPLEGERNITRNNSATRGGSKTPSEGSRGVLAMVEEPCPPQTHKDKGDTSNMSTIHAQPSFRSPAQAVAPVDGPARRGVLRVMRCEFGGTKQHGSQPSEVGSLVRAAEILQVTLRDASELLRL